MQNCFQSLNFKGIGDFLQFRLVTLHGMLAAASGEVDLFTFHLQSGMPSATLPCWFVKLRTLWAPIYGFPTSLY